MKECWKEIPGYEGFYEVSTSGKIRSLDREVLHGRWGPHSRRHVGRTLALKKLPSGYRQVALSKEGKISYRNVHRLVAATFLGPSPLQVDHIDEDKANNNLSNLQYLTPRANSQKAVRNRKNRASKFLGVGYRKGAKSPWRAWIVLNSIRHELGMFASELEAAIAYKLALTQHELQTEK